MAYIVVYHKDQEITRRELAGAITVGRSPECDLSVHDILLSRRHCKIEPEGEGWTISDLGSKNGTRVGGNPAFYLPLADGDVIRMGKTAIRFRIGAFVASSQPAPSGLKRPADPFEALAGTIRDFTFQQSIIAPNGIPLPIPKPAPKEPAAYSSDDVRSMVSELVSSSWDSIYENAKRPDPVIPHAPMVEALRRKRAREPRVDIALQAHPELAEAPLPLPPLEDVQPSLAPARKTSESPRPAPPRQMRVLIKSLAMIFQWLALAMLMWPTR